MTTSAWKREPAKLYRLDMIDGARQLRPAAPDSIASRAEALTAARERQRGEHMSRIDAAATALELERDARELRALAIATEALATPAPLTPMRVARGLWRVARAIPQLLRAELR